MYNIYCLQGFNNYYNRIVKKFNTIDEYLQYQISISKNYISFQNINFVPNDCVNTSQILNWSQPWLPDYIITEDIDTGIIMRWFTIESNRKRGQQYEFQLRRDLIVDFYDSIIDAPCFIEKANLEYDNPLIFNKENITVNQIKKSESLLKDRSGCPWLVGYYSRGEDLAGTVPTNTEIQSIPLATQTIESWKFYQYSNTSMIGPQSYATYNFKAAMGPVMTPSYFQIKVNEKNGSTNIIQIPTETVQLQSYQIKTNSEFENAFINYGLNNLNASAYSNTVSKETVDELLNFSGKIIKTLDGKYYNITVSSTQKTVEIDIPSGDLFNKLLDIIKNDLGFIGDPQSTTFKYEFTAQYYNVHIKEEKALETTYNISGARLNTLDAPWDIFAIPYGEILAYYGNESIYTSKEIAINTVMSIQATHGSKVHDIQLVPYCPIQEAISGDKELIVSDTKEYSLIKNNNDTVGIIFNVPKSVFSFDIIPEKFALSETAIQRKINSECDKWRLTSPNYSNYFDFSVEENGGITYFNVDINYKPYTPYIHVNPNFSYLYGYDDNSPRGLVLGGDFSISQIIDQWQQYQIQNKNFQNIFDRQIQNLNVVHNIQKTQDITKLITGTATGAVSGAFLGNMLGSAGAGAITGGALSLGGGIADYILNDKLRSEALDYKYDMFGYELGNIQALPNTISKVSALNNNNKIFPIIEYYTCTDTEKRAVLNKIAYNGMTVMAIDKIKNYIYNSWTYELNGETFTSKNYIKGKIIKIEDINCDDFHVANEISNEIFKGVYL